MNELIKAIMCDLKFLNLKSFTEEDFKLIENEQVLIYEKKSNLSFNQRIRVLWIYEEIWRDF